MKITSIIMLLLTGMWMSQCSQVLEKEDLSAIDGTNVWNDEKLATAYVNNLSAENLPGWDAFISSNSDESNGDNGLMYGQLNTNSIDNWPYANIRSINILLDNVEKGSLSATVKNRLKGQALFLRAWRYFDMVRNYGGVPLVLTPQQASSGEALNVSRASTSASIAQIIADLDQAALLLPAKWVGIDYGRVSKAAVLAFKGRVLLYYASPQFNPNNLPDRWQKAYEANKAAHDSLVKYGYGLYRDYAQLWFVEGTENPEAVFVQRFNEPGRPQNRDACVRPLEESVDCSGGSHPTLEMVESYPMKDGLPITDPNSGYDPVSFWENRDPRFKATIVYNGANYELSNRSGRRQWTYIGGEANGASFTGFYCRKAVNTSLTPTFALRGGGDWIEIRFAEVLLNLAECANEVGKSAEAYEPLVALRARAGIDPGASNLYGLQAQLSQSALRDAILLERKIELAFEGKRYWDLRRRRLFETQLNGKSRHQVIYTLKGMSQEDFRKIRDTVDLSKGKFDLYFNRSVVELDKSIKINFRPEYYFFAIPQSHLQLNANLKQTNGWDGGAFDPLQ